MKDERGAPVRRRADLPTAVSVGALIALSCGDDSIPDAEMGPPKDAAAGNGSQWSVIPSGTNVAVWSVWGSSADDVWVVGGTPFMLHHP
jgi:hypothetical protein